MEGEARLTREAKVRQTVFELLTEQYQQAKITEARDTPSSRSWTGSSRQSGSPSPGPP